MTDQHDRTETTQVPISAIYEQLDDHIAAAETPYDIITGLRRLRLWMAAEGLAAYSAAGQRAARTSAAQSPGRSSMLDEPVLMAAGAGSWVMARTGALIESASSPPDLARMPAPHSTEALVPRGQGGPTVLRILIGIQLRRLREASRITREAAAQAIRASEGKISRIEAGRVGLKERDLTDLLSLYGVDDQYERQALLSLVRRATTPGWWHRYQDVLPDWFEAYIALEQATTLIRTYETQFVPGLLQTQNYARAVMRLGNPGAPVREIDFRTRLRMARQQLLATASPPRLWVVIDEAALRRPLGSQEVMREQLQYLAEVTTSPNIAVQVLPFADHTYAAPGPFSLLRFPKPDLPDIVYIEQLTSALYLDRPADTDMYKSAMNQLCTAAETPAASRALILGILDEM
jgi:hypothetical protein